jgi:hypothetical protein
VFVNAHPAIWEVPSSLRAKLSDPDEVYPNKPLVPFVPELVNLIALLAVPVILPIWIALLLRATDDAPEFTLNPYVFSPITGFCIVPPNPPAVLHIPNPLSDPSTVESVFW